MSKRRGNRFARHWTKAKVLAAMKRWEKITGQPPVGADWNPARARFLAMGNQERADRWWNAIKLYEQGDWPSYTTVQDLFDGKWNDAVKSAGFIALPQGRATKELKNRWRGRPEAEQTNETGLRFQWDAVEQAMQTDDPNELKTALLDLAVIAVAYAESLNGTSA